MWVVKTRNPSSNLCSSLCFLIGSLIRGKIIIKKKPEPQIWLLKDPDPNILILSNQEGCPYLFKTLNNIIYIVKIIMMAVNELQLMNRIENYLLSRTTFYYNLFLTGKLSNLKLHGKAEKQCKGLQYMSYMYERYLYYYILSPT